MNTQKHVHELQAGQALALSELPEGRLVLVEGEVLVQGPASWIAGTVVVPTAMRFTAPSVVPLSALGSLRATGRTKLVIERAPGLVETFRAACRSALAAIPATHRSAQKS